MRSISYLALLRDDSLNAYRFGVFYFDGALAS